MAEVECITLDEDEDGQQHGGGGPGLQHPQMVRLNS